jgi:hypothetical protein
MKKEFKNNWNTPTTRTVFKWHLISFSIIVLLMWLMWYIGIKADDTMKNNEYSKFPWPVWPMVIWGFILLYHYNSVYGKRKKLPADFLKNKTKS